jgi:hypothetical protein
MMTLDLHGKRHKLIDEEVRRFLNFVDLPCEIITGNSEEMKEIVREVVEQYGWHCYEKNSYNHGVLTIVDKKI